MSDYKRGKARVCAWANHWDEVADYADSNTTIEAKMVEYGVNIRKAFQTPSEPNVLMMSRWLRMTHQDIMDLPVEQRETIITWHFGDEDEREAAFGQLRREPNSIKAIYRKVGRYFRGAHKRLQ